MKIKGVILTIIIGCLLFLPTNVFSQNTITFSTVGQQFGVMDCDHFWLSNTPSDGGIYFEQRCENPSSATVGMLIFRSNAMHGQVWGQIGTEDISPFNPVAGRVSFNNIPGSGMKYIKIRYSKHSPSTVPIEILVNNEKQMDYLPANQGS